MSSLRRVSSKRLAIASTSLLLSLGTAVVSASTSALEKQPIDWKLKERATVTDSNALAGQTFDYVIVGGGTAGLVIANRLSANSSVTVAVLEAGLDGSAVSDSILAPANAYLAGIANLDSDYDWHYQTTPQAGLNDREIYWPRGKVLAGSSAVNGLYMVRQSAIEQNSWADLIDDRENWGWDSVYPALKKSENWTAPTESYIEQAQMVLDESLHGQDGPIHYSYPGYFYDSMYEWIPTLGNMGVESRDPAGGDGWGAFFATSAINPTNWTRSYAKTGYLDPIDYRTNLVVLTGYQATKIVFDGTTATGVEFASSSTSESFTVSAREEVILSAGVIGSPQLLQVSGVGPSDLLTGLGIEVVKDLPGVGWGLTDHLSGSITLNTTFPVSADLINDNATFAAEQLALWKAGSPDSLYTAPNNAVAYVNLTTLFGEEAAQEFIAGVKANQSSAVSSYGSNSAVQSGYDATYSADVNDILSSPVGQAEILLSNTGTYGGYPDSITVQIQAALQHPFSRGSVTINSTSTFDRPQIDAGYLTHPADVQVLREAFKFARKLSQTKPFSDYVIGELSPGASVSTDEEWETWLRGAVSTEYHPASTCNMLREDHGGVIDNAMRVYGISGLRVIDFSIVPVSFSAHATSPLYGLSEHAYDLMVANPKAVGGSSVVSPSSSSSSSGSSSYSSSTATSSGSRPSSTSSQNNTQDNSATSSSRIAISSLLCIAFISFLLH
ncbi:GMC family oxidoreductase [Sporobolomyces salmoneus]|uniref:GMC family oxidoreductase n=1 Tax=Sporobolomyces salmoneus TaxID=183962 RepID=UPI00316EF630